MNGIYRWLFYTGKVEIQFDSGTYAIGRNMVGSILVDFVKILTDKYESNYDTYF